VVSSVTKWRGSSYLELSRIPPNRFQRLEHAVIALRGWVRRLNRANSKGPKSKVPSGFLESAFRKTGTDK
jgi:hypothetical protein